ncbi:unnamed protein product [Camellia sinensis]
MTLTTTSATHTSCQFNKRPKITPTSSLVEEDQQLQNPKKPKRENEIEQMKQKKEPKKTSNGGVGGDLLNEKMVRYMECRKNHAANIGGYAVDGCREFMPAGEEGTSAGFKCAACNCHRNFHRMESAENDYCDCSSVSASPK